MQFALFSNGQRRDPVAKTSYDDDHAEIVLADELGIQEAWISEHGVFVTFHAPDSSLPPIASFALHASSTWAEDRLASASNPR